MIYFPILAGLLLSSCAAAPPPPAPVPPAVPPPPELLSCPAPPPTPVLLPPVVTTDRLKRGFQALDEARQAERRRGNICADKLDRLNAWIKANQ